MKRNHYRSGLRSDNTRSVSARRLYCQSKDVVIQTVGDEVLVYHLASHKAHHLNKTAALIWDQCDGQTDVFTINTRIDSLLGESVPLDLISVAIDDLISKGLVEKQDHKRLDRTTRREMIRNAALVTAVTLPLISSIVSPTAARAQSCAAPGTPVNAFTDNGGCEFFLNAMCCSGAVNDYQFTLCCSSPQQAGIGTCTGICT